ncbi:hypothetical protein AB1Y20_018510 [Prymnesium parvum]|uniref:Aquaporin n=1 Tax=Prymnesium parvum TaxID=97485 RepID=A0AB34JNH2_PRYPA
MLDGLPVVSGGFARGMMASRLLRLASRLAAAAPRSRAPRLALGAGAASLIAGPCLSSASCAPASTPPPLWHKCIAEAFGTGMIVQLGCGVVCAHLYAGSAIGPGAIAAVWGFSVALAAHLTHRISGAHLNPAVTTALTVTGKSPVEDAPAYIFSQCVGAAIASAVNYVIFSAGIAAMEVEKKIVRGTAASTASFNGAFGMVPNPRLLTPAAAFAAEVWMTAILVFSIFAIGDPNGGVPSAAAPVFVGATVAALVTVFGPVTGSGMNPARDLGPRLVTLLAGWGAAATTSWWVYTLGPITGAVLGGMAYQKLFADLLPKKV